MLAIVPAFMILTASTERTITAPVFVKDMLNSQEENIMASKRQQALFRKQKAYALLGIINGIIDERIPDSQGEHLTTGQIIEKLDDVFQDVSKYAMLEALRDAGIYHDSNNRFSPWRLHASKDALIKQYSEYGELDN